MVRSDNIHKLPKNLPIPVDDGACQHLMGSKLPSIPLMSTQGEVIDLAEIQERTVVYVYPRTGQPDKEPLQGWDEIPGARGCTPQSCAFRDHYQELQQLNTGVYGLSTQDTDYQQEAAQRLSLPFALLSDHELAFSSALHLPTFKVESMILIKRLTLIIQKGVVKHVFYPVFPPEKNVDEVINWLESETGFSSP